jgi:hypothetical protein
MKNGGTAKRRIPKIPAAVAIAIAATRRSSGRPVAAGSDAGRPKRGKDLGVTDRSSHIAMRDLLSSRVGRACGMPPGHTKTPEGTFDH